MNFDTLFTILFIVMIVLFQVFGSILRRSGGQKQETDTDKPAGLTDRLKTIVERIRDEMEAAREAATIPPPSSGRQEGDVSARPDGWGAITKEPKPGPRRDEHVPVRKPSAVKTLPSEGRPTGAAPAALRKPERKKTVTDRIGLDRYSKREQSPAATASRTDPLFHRDSRSVKHKRLMELRRAVVWSEIMAPPLALRQDRDQMQ